MWIDANIHATEVTASVAALAVVDRLVSGFGVDDIVTRAVQTRTFYVLPRVNPDGVELALAERPRYLRSSARPWPWTDGHRPSGLYGEDVDGDGRILMMRVPDPNGAWKRHPDEPRLMTPRAITDGPGDGPYWRLFEEGSVVDHDGFTVPSPPPPEALDLNRNFPAGWSTSIPGAGDFPGSEPEIDALDPRRSGPSQHLRIQRIPHGGRRPAAAVVDRGGQHAAGRRCVGVAADRHTLHRADDVPRALGVRGLHVGQDQPDVGRSRRLGLRAHRRVLVDDRVLGRDPRRHGHACADPHLVHRPDHRGRARRAPLAGGERTSRLRRLVRLRPSAARGGRARRVGLPAHVVEPSRGIAGRRGPPPRRLRRLPGPRLALPLHRTRSCGAARARDSGGSRRASRTPDGSPPTCRNAGRRSRSPCRSRSSSTRPEGSRPSAGRPGPSWGSSRDAAGSGATVAHGWTAPPTVRWRPGSCAVRQATRWRSPPATSERARPGPPSHSLAHSRASTLGLTPFPTATLAGVAGVA